MALARLQARNGLSAEAAQQRLNAQAVTTAAARAVAHRVLVNNDADVAALRATVADLWASFLADHPTVAAAVQAPNA